MLNKLRSARHIALALKSYKKNQIKSARKHLDRYNDLSRQPDAIAIAFDATISVLEHNSSRAKEKFLEARSKAINLPEADAKFVSEYCLYYECLIMGTSDCEKHRLAALSINPSERAAMWLNLPPKEI